MELHLQRYILFFSEHYNNPIFTVLRQTKAHSYSESDEEGNVLRRSETNEGNEQDKTYTVVSVAH